ncbi:MAG: DUF2662 domain-containing protein [Anaerolineae bacterium]|nr:MAG: DUF2662 domain-containing protein [Anaerolineae bacterium]
MQERLKEIENHLQKAIEQNAVRLFSALDVEHKLAQRLVDAMQGKVVTLPDGSLQAPHIYAMNVSPKFAADLRSNQALLDTLSEALLEAGNQHGLSFEALPTINVFPDENVLEGEFQIQAMRSEPRTETAALEPEDASEQVEIPSKAFLIVGGSKIFSLDRGVINVGRKLDNHLVIDDPRVSRKHAQLRAIKNRYVIFDVGSSGGTFVNGERTSRAILHPGDVISLAGVPMVYGQDAVRAASETQEYKRPDQTYDDTTASLELSDLDLEDFSDN